MAAWPKISKGGGGVFSKNFRPGGYTKNTPYPLFPLPGYNQDLQITGFLAHPYYIIIIIINY